MKKLAVLLMALIMVMSMAACGGNNGTSGGDGTMINVVIEIDYPDESGIADVEDFQMQMPEGSSALDMLNAYGEENDVEITMSDTSATAYVTAINGVTETDAAGWVYEVNDEMTMDAANEHILAEGEEITWEFITWAEMTE